MVFFFETLFFFETHKCSGLVFDFWAWKMEIVAWKRNIGTFLMVGHRTHILRRYKSISLGHWGWPVAALKGSERSIGVRPYELSIIVRPYISLSISGAVIASRPWLLYTRVQNPTYANCFFWLFPKIYLFKEYFFYACL